MNRFFRLDLKAMGAKLQKFNRNSKPEKEIKIIQIIKH